MTNASRLWTRIRRFMGPAGTKRLSIDFATHPILLLVQWLLIFIKKSNILANLSPFLITKKAKIPKVWYFKSKNQKSFFGKAFVKKQRQKRKIGKRTHLIGLTMCCVSESREKCGISPRCKDQPRRNWLCRRTPTPPAYSSTNDPVFNGWKG